MRASTAASAQGTRPKRWRKTAAAWRGFLRVEADHLLVPYQIHSADALVANGPFSERPRCDGLVTATPGLALGVTGADCGMILSPIPKRGSSAPPMQAGKARSTACWKPRFPPWKALGADRSAIVAALGPAIGQKSYEVGPEFYERFVAAAESYADFFAAFAKRAALPSSICRGSSACASARRGSERSRISRATPTPSRSISFPTAARCTRASPITGGRCRRSRFCRADQTSGSRGECPPR